MSAVLKKKISNKDSNAEQKLTREPSTPSIASTGGTQQRHRREPSALIWTSAIQAPHRVLTFPIQVVPLCLALLPQAGLLAVAVPITLKRQKGMILMPCKDIGQSLPKHFGRRNLCWIFPGYICQLHHRHHSIRPSVHRLFLLNSQTQIYRISETRCRDRSRKAN